MNCLGQCRLIDNFAARRVYEVRAILHRLKEIRTNQHSRVGLQSDMYADDICFSCDIKGRVLSFYSQDGCLFVGETATPRDDRHAERPRARNHLLANLAETDQPQRTAK